MLFDKNFHCIHLFSLAFFLQSIFSVLTLLLFSDIMSESSLLNPYLSFLKVYISPSLRCLVLLYIHLSFMTEVDLAGKSIWDQSFHLDSPEQSD